MIDNNNMVRIGLALVLLIETILGPTLCCCTFANCVPTPKESKESNSAEKAQPKKTRPSCCHCMQENQERDSSKKNSPAPRHQCPCREGPGKAVAVVATPVAIIDFSAQRSLGDFFVDCHRMLASNPVLAAYALSEGEASVLPFITAQDLLHVHHLLRC